MGRGDSRVLRLVMVLAWILTVGGTAFAAGAEPNLVGYWKLDGNANDSAGGNHGTVFGDPAWVNDPQRGWCLDFDGEGDYVDVGDDPSLTFSDQITVACWIKVRAFDRNWNAVVTKGDDWVLARTRDDDRTAFLCLGLTGGGWPEVYSNDVNDGNWHHLAGVYDGEELILYQNGVRVGSKPLHGSINRNWSKVLIGENGQTANRFWNGLIDDVRLYNRALTADEIEVLAEAEPVAPPPPPGPRWPTMPRRSTPEWSRPQRCRVPLETWPTPSFPHPRTRHGPGHAPPSARSRNSAISAGQS